MVRPTTDVGCPRAKLHGKRWQPATLRQSARTYVLHRAARTARAGWPLRDVEWEGCSIRDNAECRSRRIRHPELQTKAAAHGKAPLQRLPILARRWSACCVPFPESLTARRQVPGGPPGRHCSAEIPGKRRAKLISTWCSRIFTRRPYSDKVERSALAECIGIWEKCG